MSQPLGPRRGAPAPGSLPDPAPRTGPLTGPKHAQKSSAKLGREPEQARGLAPSRQDGTTLKNRPAPRPTDAAPTGAHSTRAHARESSPGPQGDRPKFRFLHDASAFDQGASPHGGGGRSTDTALALGLQPPAAGLSAIAPRSRQEEGFLPGLPRPSRGPRPKTGGVRARGNSLHNFLEGWLNSFEAQQSEALTHGARPSALPLWRTPQAVALLTLPLPTQFALRNVMIRVRPKQPEPQEAPQVVAVVVRPEPPVRAQAPVGTGALGLQSPTPPAALTEPPAMGPKAGPKSLGSLLAPRSPTALVAGLNAPRGAPGPSRKDMEAQKLAQERARTKHRFAAFARRQQQLDSAEDRMGPGQDTALRQEDDGRQ